MPCSLLTDGALRVLQAHDGSVADAHSYDATWSVDGGQLNQMGSAQEAGGVSAHKTAVCDVGGWSWRGEPGNHGPFTLRFEARAKEGGGSASAVRTIFVGSDPHAHATDM
jgi:hypothetical protein